MRMCDTFAGSVLEFIACEFFCQEYNLAMGKSLFDFDIRALKNVKKEL